MPSSASVHPPARSPLLASLVPHLPTFRALCLGVVLVFVVAVVGVGVAVWSDRANDIRAGLRDARNIAVVMGGQVARSIQAVDVVLRDVQGQIEAVDTPDGAMGPMIPRPQLLRERMLQRLHALPQAFNIAVADSLGQIVVSTTSWPALPVNVADREYFQELNASDDRLIISLPLRNRIDGGQIVVFARRITGASGQFLGVVMLGLNLSYFEQIYRAVDALDHQTFALVRADGRLFVRYPGSGSLSGEQLPPDSPWYAVAAKGGGSYWSNGIFDTIPRWIAVEALKDYPFFVQIGVPEYVMLRAWRLRTAVTLAATAIFFCIAVALLWVMARQFRHLSRSEASLAEKTQALEEEHARLLANESELRLHNERFEAALSNMSQGLAMFDRARRLVVCNKRYREILGLPAELTPPGTPLRAIVQASPNVELPCEIDAFVAGLVSLATGPSATSHEQSLRDGRTISVIDRPMSGGGWLSTFADITARREAEDKIKRLAEHDLLTGVSNRLRFVEQIEEARQKLQSDGRPFTVIMLDLDRFKTVNDSLGHVAGDTLLKQMAERLTAAIRSTDVLARLGGDEFAIIQAPPRNFIPGDDMTEIMHESAIVLAGRLIEVIDEPFDIEGQKVVIGASVGVAMAPKDAVDPEDLLKKADLALYSIKGAGRNGFAFFDPKMAATADERHRLEVDLRAGMTRGEFELYYQPIVDTATQQVHAMEALVRWNHPDYGLIAPDRFISMAEETGLVATLGEWILQTACAEAATWPEHVKIAINISPVQFRRTNLLDVIMCALVDSDLSPERLEIEITERVLLEWEAGHLSILHQLRNLGVSIALDDFGTGYSSLGYLTAFPFDKLKIDRSFTRDLLIKHDCNAIVGTIINLGRALGIVTVAEGVESEPQLAALRLAGVNQVQGYFIGRPLPSAGLDFTGSSLPSECHSEWDALYGAVA